MRISILVFICLFSIQSAQGVGQNSSAETLLSETSQPAAAQASRIPFITQSIKRNLGLLTTAVGIGGASAFVFYEKYSEEKEKGVCEEYAISGGCTAALQKVIIPVVCLPAARVMMSQIQRTRIGSYLGLHSRIDLHKWTAVLFGAAAAVHTSCSIVANPEVIESYEARTGALMWSGVLVPIVGGYLCKDIPCLRPWTTYTKRFLRPHQLGFLMVVGGYAFHKQKLKLLPWAAIPLGEIVLDRLMEFALFTYNTTVTEAKIQGDKVLLTVEKPKKLKVEPGQFVYLEIQGEYHPFTVAQSDDTQLSFVISSVGPGTQELFERIDKNEWPIPSPLSLKGPYASIIQGALESSSPMVLVSSGSGVSVTTSLLQAFGEKGEGKILALIHSERNPDSFSILLDAVEKVKDSGVSIGSVHLFLTSKDEAESAEPDLEKLQRDLPVFLHRSRLSPENLASLLSDPEAHVVISGSPSFMRQVENFCRTSGMNYTKEAFQF